jgi:hypothetical protein
MARRIQISELLERRARLDQELHAVESEIQKILDGSGSEASENSNFKPQTSSKLRISKELQALVPSKTTIQAYSISQMANGGAFDRFKRLIQKRNRLRLQVEVLGLEAESFFAAVNLLIRECAARGSGIDLEQRPQLHPRIQAALSALGGCA